MFNIRIRRADHVRQYSIHPAAGGWDVKVEEDLKLTRHVRLHDWHRVEQTREMFRRDVAELTAHGWVVTSA